MPKIVNTVLKAKAKAKAWTFEAKAKARGPEAKAIKFGLEAPRGQGLASRTTSLPQFHRRGTYSVLSGSHSIVCLFVWCLTAFSAQIGYIEP